MLVLGISDSHDASVCLIENDNILAAVSEERFTRRKRQQGFPYRSLEYIRGLIAQRDIDKVYISGKYGRSIFRLLDRFYAKTNPQKDLFSLSSKIACGLENTLATIPVFKEVESHLGLYIIKKRLRRAGIRYRKVALIDHHYSHLVSALTGLDSNNCLLVSLDAYGDAKSGLIVYAEDKKIINIKEIAYKNSIASFYGYICAYLGFKEGEEGKVMALAAYGKEGILLNTFREIFTVFASGLKVSDKYKSRYFLKKLDKYTKEDIAYALQRTIEEATSLFITRCIPAQKKPDLFLAGGFFANIKVNQRLHETGRFNRIFIFPHMGDGGTAFVSALGENGLADPDKYIVNIAKLNPVKLKDVYLGPEYTNEYIKNVLKASHLFYTEEEDIETKVAGLLAAGKAVARFNGGMEYGPRALGNRSILYRTDDPTVNDWLNKRLWRTEYMPFAPVTLFEFKDRCYLNMGGVVRAAQFMTISFECTEWMKKTSPGVIHVDGTARPQLLKEEDNPSFYKILKAYYDITGIPSLINTSFNMHNEPIVCSPEDTLRTFNLARIDYLAIGKFLVFR